MNNLPPTIDARGLAALLYKSKSTILRDVSRNPQSLPPFIKVGKGTIWLTQVVLAWLAEKSSEAITIKIEFCLQPTSTTARSAPPVMRSLAEELMVASAGSAS